MIDWEPDCFRPCNHISSLEDQLCMFDFSDCQRVMPGGNCTIRCGSDYEGKSTIAYCPSDNTDPNGQLVYLEPKCSLKPCEMNAPVGYVETPCGWECATGYIGSVSWYCAAIGSQPGRCRSELVISGCTLTVQCAPLMVNDTCRRRTVKVISNHWNLSHPQAEVICRYLLATKVR